MPLNTVKLSEGVEGLFVKNERFNTTLISFNFYLPLKNETVADNALLPFLLTTCSNKYPDFSKLNYKLDKLYGAQLCASSEKAGDYQLLKVSISVIGNKYTLDNEDLTTEACDMLFELIFSPSVQNGAFLEEDIKREKRKAVEHIRGELSDKRIYSKQRLIGEMYKGEPYGVPKCGTEEQINSVTGESLYKAWKNMIESAYISVNVISGTMPSDLFDRVSDKFSCVVRKNITDVSLTAPTAEIETPNEITERMEISQGKLVMGFSSKLSGSGDEVLPLSVMCDIFGGGPYSKLFLNVREKMSLCYYCSASSIKTKGLITVDSGVEEQNAQKAKNEILNQLKALQNGELTDFEFSSSLKSMSDSLKTYNDSQELLDTWYSLRVVSGGTVSPEEMAQDIVKVTKQQVIDAAKGVKLHTVYRLLPLEVK